MFFCKYTHTTARCMTIRGRIYKCGIRILMRSSLSRIWNREIDLVYSQLFATSWRLDLSLTHICRSEPATKNCPSKKYGKSQYSKCPQLGGNEKMGAFHLPETFCSTALKMGHVHISGQKAHGDRPVCRNLGIETAKKLKCWDGFESRGVYF